MNARNESKLNMYRIIKQICDDNTTTITANVAFLAVFTIFRAKLSSLITTLTSESQVITGIAIDKTVLKKNLSQTTADIAAIIFSYASATANNTLKQAVNFPYSDLFKIKDDQLPSTCQTIHASATANATALAPYGITPAMLTTLQTAITDYSNAVPKPGTAKSNKTTYTKNISQLIKDIDLILKEQMDKLVIAFKPTKPDFYNSYKNGRTIIDPSTTTTQLKGKIIDKATEAPIKNATVVITRATPITLITTKSGNYTQKPISTGTYAITVTAEGYTTQTIDAYIVKLGKINKQDFKLIAE